MPLPLRSAMSILRARNGNNCVIGRLTGVLIEVDGSVLVLDTGGVGYEVEVSAGVLAAQPQIGSEISLYTHFVVREDAQLLYGFETRGERDLFRAYIKITGVGPKLGLALISSIDPSGLARAVRSNDVSVLTRVPGVGKKTADRLMLELKNRLDDLTEAAGAPLVVVSGAATDRAVELEAEDALVALGYRPQDAARVIARVCNELEDDAGVEAVVRGALRVFASQQEVG